MKRAAPLEGWEKFIPPKRRKRPGRRSSNRPRRGHSLAGFISLTHSRILYLSKGFYQANRIKPRHDLLYTYVQSGWQENRPGRSVTRFIADDW
jgi:hypothetical protein